MNKRFSLIILLPFIISTFLFSCEEEKKAPSYDQLLEEHENDEFSVKSAIAIGVLFLIGYLVTNSNKSSSNKGSSHNYDDDNDWKHPEV